MITEFRHYLTCLEYRNDPEPHLVYKMILLGDFGVGKTKLNEVFNTGKFNKNLFKKNKGFDFVLKPLKLNKKLYKV